MQIGDLFLRIVADTKGFAADLNLTAGKAGDAAGKTLGQKMGAGLKEPLKKGLAQGIGLGGGLGAVDLAAKAIAGVTHVIFDSIAAARDLNETVNKSQVVFGDAASGIKAWGETAARSMGLSENAAIGAAASIGNLLLSTGTAKEKIAPMSEGIVQLASDLASFNNIPIEDALAKLQSGLVGQERPLRELGVAISAASVDTEALALGFKKVNGQFTEGEKVQARYSLIFKQTKTAQGDFARTSDGLANSQRILNAEMEDATAKLGQALLPAITALVHYLGTDAVPAVMAFVDEIVLIATKGQQVVDWANSLVDPLHKAGEATDGLGSKTTLLGGAIHFLADQLTNVSGQQQYFAAVTKGTASVVDSDGRGMAKSLGGVVDAAKTLVTAGVPPFHRIRDASGNAAARIKENARDIATAIKTLTTKLIVEAQALIDGYYDPIIAQDQLRVDKDTVHADTIARNATKAGTAERHQADLTLANSQKNLDQTRLNLLASGTLTAKDQKAWLADLQAKYKTATGTARTEIGKLIAKIKELQGISGAHVNISTTFKIGGKATGGPVQAGTPYWVGEHGPELVIPRVNSTVIPHAASMAAAGGGGNTYNITANVEGLVKAPDPLAIARVLGRYARNGTLDPVAQ